ncbi:MAG: prolipoprotein diacylglyceryl transferase [Deltaproteobacteria bacterium]|nr:prolipoprotein diacylglyceryl transferase [Deltaproteobacteria bacterium]
MHPILFKFGPITIYTYGFFLALGFVTAIILAGREAKRVGLPVGTFYDLCFYIIIAALVGSRLLYVLMEWSYFVEHPLEVFVLWKGGLIFHGGLVLGIIVGFYFMRRYGLPWRLTFDSLAVGTPVGQSLGRVGCFMAGCCYGKPSNLPWAVTFTDPNTLCPFRESLHPSQLYEALLLLPVFGVVYWMRTRKRFDGQLTLTYLLLAGIVRFVTEFFRHPADYRGPIIIWDMPATQVVAFLIAVVSGLLLFRFWQKAGKAAD